MTAAGLACLAALGPGALTARAQLGPFPCVVDRVLTTPDGVLTVEVDGLGAFGDPTSVPTAGDATYDPPGAAQGPLTTVKTNNVYVGAPLTRFLDDPCAPDDGIPTVVLAEDSDLLSTRKTFGQLQVEVDQTVVTLPGGSAQLFQEYTLTNNLEAPDLPAFPILRHADGDLIFDGNPLLDRAAAQPGGITLYQFDGAAGAPAGYVSSLAVVDVVGAPSTWTIQPFDYRPTILAQNGILAAHHQNVPAGSGDWTMSQQWNVPGLARGASATLLVITTFGPLPDAMDDVAVVGEDGGGVDILVRTNDVDLDTTTPMVVTVIPTDPLSGTATIQGGVAVRYTPGPGFSGFDSFEYTVDDGAGHTDTATVFVTINPANDLPIALGDEIAVPAGGEVVFNPLLNDSPGPGEAGQTLSLGAIGPPAHGTAEAAGGGSIRYRPVVGYSGPDFFTYQVCDNGSPIQCALGLVSVNVQQQPVTLSIGDASLIERDSGTRAATFTVTLAPAAGLPVSAAFATANGTAGEGDFQPTSGTVSFAPGETTKTITVLVAGDTRDEPNETYFVRLSAPVNASIADGEGLGTIVDDDLPPPVVGRTVNAEPVSGTVLVRRPGTNQFVPLRADQQVPVGSQVDTRRGRIQLTTANQNDKAGGTAQFYEGLFTLLQARARGAVLELRLDGGDFRKICGAAGTGKRRTSSVGQQPKKKKVRRLWGSGKGKFRTRGRFSAATVRGTIWLTEDRCDGTLTRVRQGSVTVRDLARNKTVVVRAGRSYVARPR